MILEGKYNKAIIYTDKIEHAALLQINNLLNQPFVAGSKIRIMPDVHSGAGCVIGTTERIDAPERAREGVVLDGNYR